MAIWLYDNGIVLPFILDGYMGMWLWHGYMAWYGCIWLHGYMPVWPWHGIAVYSYRVSGYMTMAWYG